MPPAAGIGSVTTSTSTLFSSRPRRFVIMPRRKQRCWIFTVGGITNDGPSGDLLASVCKRYTTAKRLVIRPAPSTEAGPEAGAAGATGARNVHVEVEFTGPLPSEGPGALLCHLLSGSSVQAKPVELPRGRKKRPRPDAASSEASDSDVDERRSRKMSCHQNVNSRQQTGERGGKENSPDGSRCVTAKTVLKGFESRGALAASSEMAPHSSDSPLKMSSISIQPKLPSISCVVVPSDSRTMAGLMQPNLTRAVSLDSVHQQQHVSDHQHVSAIHHQQTQVKAVSGAQRHRDLGCIPTPQGLSHALDTGSGDTSTSEHQVDGADFDTLLGSTNSGGPWGSNDIPSELFSPIPPPQPVQPSLAGWSFDFDSSHPREALAGDFNSDKIVMDLSDVDHSLGSTETDGTPAAGARSVVSARSVSINSDTGTESWPEHRVSQTQPLTTEGILPMEKVLIEPSRKVCDFEGRPTPTSCPRSSTTPFPDGQSHMVFTGLEKTGHDFDSLRVTAHFEIDSGHRVGEGTGPIKVGADGRAYATICYPSMREIWPELHGTRCIQVIQVDVVVEIRSDCGKYQYVGPQLKVAYRRTPPVGAGGLLAEPEPLPQGRRILSRALTPSSGDQPQTPLTYEDYASFDRLSDTCHYAFRGGGTTHQPLPDDPNDIVDVHP